jgi:hypothetical protein
MLYREIIAVCSQIHTKHINTLCGQNVGFLNVKMVVHIVTTVVYRLNWSVKWGFLSEILFQDRTTDTDLRQRQHVCLFMLIFLCYNSRFHKHMIKTIEVSKNSRPVTHDKWQNVTRHEYWVKACQLNLTGTYNTNNWRLIRPHTK